MQARRVTARVTGWEEEPSRAGCRAAKPDGHLSHEHLLVLHAADYRYQPCCLSR